MNRITLSGNAATNPDPRYTGTGKLVVHFAVAVQKGFKRDENGNYPVHFFDVETWGMTAEICNDRLLKGDRILIDGHLDTDLYEQNGERKKRTKIIADRIEYFQNRKNRQKESSEETDDVYVSDNDRMEAEADMKNKAPSVTESNPPYDGTAAGVPDSEIPF